MVCRSRLRGSDGSSAMVGTGAGLEKIGAVFVGVGAGRATTGFEGVRDGCLEGVEAGDEATASAAASAASAASAAARSCVSSISSSNSSTGSVSVSFLDVLPGGAPASSLVGERARLTDVAIAGNEDLAAAVSGRVCLVVSLANSGTSILMRILMSILIVHRKSAEQCVVEQSKGTAGNVELTQPHFCLLAVSRAEWSEWSPHASASRSSLPIYAKPNPIRSDKSNTFSSTPQPQPWCHQIHPACTTPSNKLPPQHSERRHCASLPANTTSSFMHPQSPSSNTRSTSTASSSTQASGTMPSRRLPMASSRIRTMTPLLPETWTVSTITVLG